VDGAQQETVITFFVVILKSNVVILTLVGTITFLSYVNLLTIRNNECTAKYEKIIVGSIVCAESGTGIVKNSCNVSFLKNF
jgi:hypothetical protein